MVGQGPDMALRTPGGNNHMVGQGRFSLKINGYNVLRQIIIKAGQNHLVKRAVFKIGALRLCLWRIGLWLFVTQSVFLTVLDTK